MSGLKQKTPTPTRPLTAKAASASAPVTPLAAATPASPRGLAGDLEVLLASYTAAYQELSLSLAAHREAIRLADTPRLEQVVEGQARIVARIADLDVSRRSLLAAAMREKLIPPGQDAKLTSVAAALPEPQRTTLTQGAISLRELVTKVQKEQSGIRLAATSLASHMEGLVRHVAKKLSHAGVYSRRGVVEGLVLASALDIRR